MSVFSLFPALTRWMVGSWIAVGAGLVLSISYLLLAPEPRTVVPVVQLPDPVADGELENRAIEGLAFVQRPLFAESRRPPMALELAEPQAQAEARPIEDMDGFKLLGVFGSGGRLGAILRDDNEQQVRMMVGDENEAGWVLKSVSPRRAVFASSSDSNVLAELALELAAVSGAPVTSAVPQGEPATVTDELNREMTFDAIAKRRAEKKRKEVEDR